MRLPVKFSSGRKLQGQKSKKAARVVFPLKWQVKIIKQTHKVRKSLSRHTRKSNHGQIRTPPPGDKLRLVKA